MIEDFMHGGGTLAILIALITLAIFLLPED